MKRDKKFDVFGVGNAIVDILAQVDHRFVTDLGLHYGSMTLMDADQQAVILQKLEHHPLSLASGGSAANTMVAVVQCGGTALYSGKVAHDMHGEFYQRDLQAAGVGYHVSPARQAGFPTGTSIVLTTPDAERTMCTHLGISTALCVSDIDLHRLAQCRSSYIEGYLWDSEQPRAACLEVFEQSDRLGVPAAFTFSDPWLVDRFADDFKTLLREHCDIVFCNSDEAMRFFETDNIRECISKMGELCDLGFVTASEKGCYVVHDGHIRHVAGFPVRPIDTSGAGDAFAGGTLYGLARGMPPQDAARLGNYLASKIVAVIGPRLDGPDTIVSIREGLQAIMA